MPIFFKKMKPEAEKAMRIWKLNSLKTRLPAIDGLDKSLIRAIGFYNEMREAFFELNGYGYAQWNETVIENKRKLSSSTFAACDALATIGYKCKIISGILADAWSLEQALKEDKIPISQADEKIRELEDRINKFKLHLNPNVDLVGEYRYGKDVEKFWEPYWECSVPKDKMQQRYDDGYCSRVDYSTPIKP